MDVKQQKSLRIKLDTGAEVNVMSKRVYDQLKKCNKKITKTSVKLHGYGEYGIPVLDTTRLECSVNDVRKLHISVGHRQKAGKF